MRAMVVVALLVTGCVADRADNPYFGCTDDADCEAGEICDRGFCIPDEVQVGCDPALRCYEGPEETDGVGRCQPGCLVELDGESFCEGQVLPSAEECNGVDDDCDGKIDEDFPLDTIDQCGACDTQCAPGAACCMGADGHHECANLASDANHCGECGKRCSVGEVCCGGTCVDISEDEENCGACGRRCDERLTCCDGACVNIKVSSEHCGGCGVASCGDPTVCCPGLDDPSPQCREPDECQKCDDPDCDEEAGDLCCAGECIKDQLTNDAHCGGCGIACAADERCCGGLCVPLDENCTRCGDDCSATGRLCCGECTPITDPTNCGGCGVTCAPGETCCGEAGCVNTLTNNSHCGGCNQSCGENICSNGHCCPPGHHFCDGKCVALSSNAHCGRCGNKCGTNFLDFRTCMACRDGRFECSLFGC